MALKINYGSDVVVLPADAVEGCRGDDLAVLALICRMAGKVDDRESLIGAVVRKSGRSETDVAKSVDHWEKKGVFAFGDADDSLDEAIKSAKKDRSSVEIPDRHPQYSGKEAAGIIDSTAGMRELISECQLAVGKIFTASEVTSIITMSDYLRFTNEYIITLVTWCCGTGHKSLRYIERTAYNLFDEGITSVEALHEHISRLNAEYDDEARFKAALGLGGRDLTKKESSFLHRWLYDFGMSFDVIKKAYEITIDGTRDHKLSYEYMNKVLENWHSSGAKDISDVDRLISDYAEGKRRSGESGASSFDTDEFFELALKRSYEQLGGSDTGDPGQ